jgi:hypothetical protein
MMSMLDVIVSSISNEKRACGAHKEPANQRKSASFPRAPLFLAGYSLKNHNSLNLVHCTKKCKCKATSQISSIFQSACVKQILQSILPPRHRGRRGGRRPGRLTRTACFKPSANMICSLRSFAANCFGRRPATERPVASNP